MQCIGIVFFPFVAVLLFVSPEQAFYGVAGIAAAALSSIAIQLWFRSQAKRSQFRRRHTSSRIATLAEAIISIAWAGAGGIAVTGNPLWVVAALSAGFCSGASGGSVRHGCDSPDMKIGGRCRRHFIHVARQFCQQRVEGFLFSGP